MDRNGDGPDGDGTAEDGDPGRGETETQSGDSGDTREREHRYRVLDPGAMEPTPDHPCDRRSLSEAADLAALAAAVYEINPGEQLPRTYHYHEQREELFYVLAGELAVETPGETYAVPAGRVFVAHPGSPHRAHNPESAADPVSVLGVGAPAYDVARPYEPGENGG
jgi:quercetin dioxygenase-like cupin family protein